MSLFSIELSTLVTNRVMTLLHDLIQAHKRSAVDHVQRAKPADCLKQLHSRAAEIGQHDTGNPIELGNCPSGVFRMARHVLRNATSCFASTSSP